MRVLLRHMLNSHNYVVTNVWFRSMLSRDFSLIIIFFINFILTLWLYKNTCEL